MLDLRAEPSWLGMRWSERVRVPRGLGWTAYVPVSILTDPIHQPPRSRPLCDTSRHVNLLENRDIAFVARWYQFFGLQIRIVGLVGQVTQGLEVKVTSKHQTIIRT